jgi:hypothetical protein
MNPCRTWAWVTAWPLSRSSVRGASNLSAGNQCRPRHDLRSATVSALAVMKTWRGRVRIPQGRNAYEMADAMIEAPYPPRENSIPYTQVSKTDPLSRLSNKITCLVSAGTKPCQGVPAVLEQKTTIWCKCLYSLSLHPYESPMRRATRALSSSRVAPVFQAARSDRRPWRFRA